VHDHSNIPLVYSNAKSPARALHAYWIKRYNNQFPPHDPGPGPRITGLFGRKASNLPEAPPPYQEPEDEIVFEDVLVTLELPLGSAPLKGIQENLIKMSEKFQEVEWHA